MNNITMCVHQNQHSPFHAPTGEDTSYSILSHTQLSMVNEVELRGPTQHATQHLNCYLSSAAQRLVSPIAVIYPPDSCMASPQSAT